ncbi:transposase [Rhizobium leguminosarum]|nr:transposase [Rhizobium leguminosarum]
MVEDAPPRLTKQLALISQITKPRRGDSPTLSRWDGLTCFIEANATEIDSNTVEHSIRPIAGPQSLRTPSFGSVYASATLHERAFPDSRISQIAAE